MEAKWSKITLDELDQVLALYQSVLGQEGCTWTEDYPSRSDLLGDIQAQALYGIHADGRLIAAIARDRDERIDALDCWSRELRPAAELARLVVAREYQNRGIARKMILAMMELLKEQGYRSVHYLVAGRNVRAVRSYAKLDFSCVGETDLFEEHWLCYEKAL